MKYSQSAVNKYQKDKYYKISVNIPREYKDNLQKEADRRGVSVSRMVAQILGDSLGLDLVLDGVLPSLKGRSDEDASSGT